MSNNIQPYLSIDAYVITATVSAPSALINVQAACARGGLFETLVANALVGAHHVLTNSI